MARAATIALWLTTMSVTAGEFDDTPHVRATLVADVQGIVPGGTFRLGVLLAVERGWHVYWRNPGDAGLSTDVEFQLPEGLTAGPLQWPIPKVFKQPGDLVGYGYEASVLHWVTVTVPERLPVGSSLAFGAQVSWLACKEICVPDGGPLELVPDGGPLELVLPVTATAEPANRKVFASWQVRLPVRPAEARELESVSVTGGIPAGANAGAFEIDAVWRTPVSGVAWCPAAGESVGVEKIVVTHGKGWSKIRFRSLLLGDGGERILDSVLLYTDRDGKRGGIAIPVPLRAGR